MQRLLKVLLALFLLVVGMALVVLPAKEFGFQEKQHPSRKGRLRKKMLVGGMGKQHFAFEDADFLPRRTLRHKDHISPPSPLLNAHRGYGHGSYGGCGHPVPPPPSYGGYGSYGHPAPPPPSYGGYGSCGHPVLPPPSPLPPMTNEPALTATAGKLCTRKMLVAVGRQAKQSFGFGDTGIPKRTLRSGGITFIPSPMSNPSTHQAVPPPPMLGQ